MCEFASFVLTKDFEFWCADTDSHSNIIERYGLHEDGCRGPNILRVEITPPEDNETAPIEQWKYHVDQDTFPEWFDSDLCEQRARTALLRRSQSECWFEELIGHQVVTGYAGTATAGARGTATAGNDGTISIRWWDGNRYRILSADVGENGIKPNTPYCVVDGKLVEKS